MFARTRLRGAVPRKTISNVVVDVPFFLFWTILLKNTPPVVKGENSKCRLCYRLPRTWTVLNTAGAIPTYCWPADPVASSVSTTPGTGFFVNKQYNDSQSAIWNNFIILFSLKSTSGSAVDLQVKMHHNLSQHYLQFIIILEFYFVFSFEISLDLSAPR